MNRKPRTHQPRRSMISQEETASTTPSSEQAWIMVILTLAVLILGLYQLYDTRSKQPDRSAKAVVATQAGVESPAGAVTGDPILNDQGNPTRTSSEPSTHLSPRNARLVRRFYDEVLNQQQFALMGDLFAEHVVYGSPGLTTTLSLAALRQQLRTESTAYADLYYSIERVTTHGDWLSVEWSAVGRPPILWADNPPAAELGELHVWSGYTVWKVVDGKIIQMLTSPAPTLEPAASLLIRSNAEARDADRSENADPAAILDSNAKERLVRRFYDEVLNQGHKLAMPFLFAGQVTYQACGSTPTTFSTVEFTQSLLAEQRRFHGLTYTIDHVSVNGDRVGVGWSAEGRLIDPFAAKQDAGQKVTWSGLTVWQIANGKIVAGWSVDTGSLCRTE